MSFFQSKSCFPTKFDIELNISSDVVAAVKDWEYKISSCVITSRFIQSHPLE
ncbi:unnamed protein product [Acanthoscelides obtectus]|uniref:Uncharacterized protein n=1 Tax=Acanthoscelides obtectus TaxID=200917 RepID=A0A9P0M1B6_ACAOB|nr:unnamed protein product [Acanthoscelides obtectus]CAK1633320.1 hypothetical protein AOBTE_LOCUS8040 [Acanthoscelides obtectus]